MGNSQKNVEIGLGIDNLNHLTFIYSFIFQYSKYLTSKTLPNIKLSGLKICPNGPERTESIVPGSKSTKTARGTYLPPTNEQKYNFNTNIKALKIFAKVLYNNISHPKLRCNRRLFFPAVNPNRRDMFPWGLCHVRQK